MKNNFQALSSLVRRNVKLFLKDKATVFFSLLAPLIVLMLYILFLGDIQKDAVEAVLKEAGQSVDNKLIMGFINNWMLSGVMGVSCITVALSANMIMVRDKEKGSINDILVSPIKRWVIFASYIISCFLITFFICMAVLVVGFIYLIATGGFMMTFVDVLYCLGITILSIISSSLFMVFICSFIQTEAALGSFTGILSAAIGFLTGAYMPLSMFPKAIQYFVCFIPGTYSAGLFRNIFLHGPMQRMLQTLPSDLVSQLMENYSVNIKFFSYNISPVWMMVALVLSVVLFGTILAVLYSNKKSGSLLVKEKKKKKRIK